MENVKQKTTMTKIQTTIPFSKPVVLNFETKKKIILEALQEKDSITKPELCKLLGWEYNSNKDRQIRDIVADIAKEYPIISTSDNNKGFRLAKTAADVEEVEHTWKEFDKRILEMNNRKKALIEFYKKHKYTPVEPAQA